MKTTISRGFIRFNIILFISLSTFWLSPILVKAQNPTFINYTNVEGLPSNEIYMVLQDRYGYVWMATNYGVSRFDGYKFENFTTADGLTDNTVYELFEDYIGRMWFITSNLKFSYFDGEEIRQYKFNDKLSKELGWTPYYENRSFWVDSLDNLWFSIYSKGVYKISNNGNINKIGTDLKYSWSILKTSKNKFQLNRTSKTFVEDSLIFVSDKGTNILKINNRNLNYATSFLFFSKQKRLYYTHDNSLYVIDPDGYGIVSYSLPDYIISLDEDIEGNLWIGFRNNGAICYEKGDLTKKPFLHVLKGLPVSKVFSDNEGGLWFSTTTNGVFYTQTLSILTYSVKDGLVDNQIYGINNCYENGITVFFRDKRYNVIYDGKVTQHIEKDIPPDENIEKIQKKYNKKWIITNKMAYVQENGKTRRIIDAYKTPEIYHKIVWNANSILEVDSNLVYLSFASFICEAKNGKIKSIISPELLAGVSSLCLGSDSTVYFGTKIGPGWLKNDSIGLFYVKYPELRLKVNCVMFNNRENSLWIATKGNGIYILKDKKISNISVKNGLASNYVKHLFQNNDGIWISTNQGINLIYKTNYRDTIYNVRTINSTLGLVSNEVNMICASENKVYVATDIGLSFFNFSDMSFHNDDNKSVKITKIQINERDTSLLRNYILPYDFSSIRITFKYLSYKNAGKHNYLYRLRGLSDEWQQTNSTNIVYTTLPAGKYVFEVKFMSSDKTHSERKQSFEFEILKPYWKTWWFILFIAFLVLSLIYVLYVIRITTISNRNKLERQIIEYQSKALSSQINPHFIFNSLNSIQLYILNNDTVKSNKYLTKFSNLMRSVLENSMESSISLETEIKTLTNYIDIESIRFQNKFEYEIIVDSNIDTHKVKIPTLLIQPFVENAIWHGLMNKEGKGFLSVSISDIGTSIKCIIKDNGIGRIKSGEINLSKTTSHKSLGAQITQERLKLLNTLYKSDLKIIITDIYSPTGTPEGTKIELNIPKITK